MQTRKVGAAWIVCLLAVTAPAVCAAGASKTMHLPIHPGPAAVRAFAETALQHLKGPAQRPFLKLLNSLPPPAKQPGVVISTKATKNIQCSGGVCTPTAAKAILNVSELTRLLVAGNVTIATSAAAPDIFINAPFSWTSANTLTLQAIGDIMVNKAVSDTGPGPLDLEYDITGGTGGMLSFGNKGSISFMGLSNPLIINGQSYVLAPDIRTMARLIQDSPSGNFALARSYDARHDGTYPQSPVMTPFQGNFEGLGNSISGLRIECTGCDQLGLFEQALSSARISDIRMVVREIDFGDGVVEIAIGGLVADNRGIVSGVTINTNFSATCNGQQGFIGGLVAFNEGTVFNSSVVGSVADDSSCSEGSEIGGLAGDNSGDVTYGTANVAVNGLGQEDFSGGLVGGNSGVIKLSDAVGPARGAFTGGLVGLNDGSIFNSSALGSATGSEVAGGLIGEIGNTVISVDSCSAGGAVSGGSDAGGLIGLAYQSDVSNCTSYGTVAGTLFVGGFVGDDAYAPGLWSNDGWCTTSSGITDPSKGAGDYPYDPGITPFSC